jgi:hypothetical protein
MSKSHGIYQSKNVLLKVRRKLEKVQYHPISPVHLG